MKIIINRKSRDEQLKEQMEEFRDVISVLNGYTTYDEVNYKNCLKKFGLKPPKDVLSKLYEKI